MIDLTNDFLLKIEVDRRIESSVMEERIIFKIGKYSDDTSIQSWESLVTKATKTKWIHVMFTLGCNKLRAKGPISFYSISYYDFGANEQIKREEFLSNDCPEGISWSFETGYFYIAENYPTDNSGFTGQILDFRFYPGIFFDTVNFDWENFISDFR